MEPTAILAAIALVPQPAKLVETGGAAPASAEVRYVEDASVPAEGYRLSVATNGVTVASSDAAGRFYAGVTLEQLARPDGSRPCVEIEDAPAFPWRGMHLDVSRHFFTADEVKRFLDLMAAHKLNRFHWHLTDNQGWRLDVPSHPELAAASAEKRGKTIEGRPDENRGEDFAGPCFYTEEQVRDIVAYAAARHIEIVPEIEMPGHFGSVLAAHPEFACTDADGKRTGWNELCVGNDEAIACLEDVLDDVCRLFPFGVVHVGGDECSRDRWRECPKCRARIEAESLADEDALQTWLSARMVRFLVARGKRAIGWDEYLLGDGISTNAIGMRWRGAGGASEGPGRQRDPGNGVPGSFCPHGAAAEVRRPGGRERAHGNDPRRKATARCGSGGHGSAGRHGGGDRRIERRGGQPDRRPAADRPGIRPLEREPAAPRCAA